MSETKIDMTEDEFMRMVLDVLPDATLDTDSDGQLVVNTDCHIVLVAGEWRVQAIGAEEPRCNHDPVAVVNGVYGCGEVVGS